MSTEKVIATAQHKGMPEGAPRSDVAALFEQVTRLRTYLGTRALTAAGLAIGSGSKAKVLIANTVTYLIDGEFKTKTTAEITITTAASMADDGTARERYLAFTLPAGGTPSVTYGAVATGGAAAVRPVASELPAGEALIGYIKIAAAALTAYVGGTTEFDAAGITDTYEDKVWNTLDFPSLSYRD